jgi:hypothetical protein
VLLFLLLASAYIRGELVHMQEGYDRRYVVQRLFVFIVCYFVLLFCC